MTYRPLTEQEVARLEARGCRCGNWQEVEVAPDFVPEHVSDTYFAGRVLMEAFDGTADLGDGVRLPAGIRHAVLNDCVIGRNACITGVRRHLSHCRVGEEAVVADVSSVSATEGYAEIGARARVVQCGRLCNVRIAAGMSLERVPCLSDAVLSPFAAWTPAGDEPAEAPAEEPTMWDTMPDDDFYDDTAAQQPAADEPAPAPMDPAAPAPAPDAPAMPSVPQEAPAASAEAPAPAPQEPPVTPPAAAASAEEAPAAAALSEPRETAAQPMREATLFDAWDDWSRPVLADTLPAGHSPLNEKFSTGTPLADALQDRPLARLEDGIGLNDRFLFTRELFKSNPTLYKACIKKVEACTGRQEALACLAECFDTASASAAAGKFLSLIHRRFPADE